MTDPNRTTGFTLAEAMIAMVILSTAAAAVILPFSAGAAVHNQGARQTMASQLAAEIIEKAKNEPFDTLWLYEGYVEAAGAMYDANWQLYTDDAYSRFSRRTACADAIVAGETLKWVTAYVYYGNNEVMRLSTLIGP